MNTTNLKFSKRLDKNFLKKKKSTIKKEILNPLCYITKPRPLAIKLDLQIIAINNFDKLYCHCKSKTSSIWNRKWKYCPILKLKGFFFLKAKLKGFGKKHKPESTQLLWNYWTSPFHPFFFSVSYFHCKHLQSTCSLKM